MAGMEWVPVCVAPNESLAAMVAGFLEDAGIPTRLYSPLAAIMGAGATYEVQVPTARRDEAQQVLSRIT